MAALLSGVRLVEAGEHNMEVFPHDRNVIPSQQNYRLDAIGGLTGFRTQVLLPISPNSGIEWV